MNKSASYQLGRLYGRLPTAGRLAIFILIGAGIAWALLPSEPTPLKIAVSNKTDTASPPTYDPIAKWGEAKVTAANKVMALAQRDCAIYEEGPHLVVEMKAYITEPNQRLQYVRAITDTDVILHGTPRNIYFYDPSHKKIAQADKLNGIRLSE